MEYWPEGNHLTYDAQKLVYTNIPCSANNRQEKKWQIQGKKFSTSAQSKDSP
jgi:hypothetical protein